MRELKEVKKRRKLTMTWLLDLTLVILMLIGVLTSILALVSLIGGLFFSTAEASEPLNVTNVHYTADNGLQSGNTFTLREGYRERIYYQIEYTGDGNPADLMLMWNDYQGIEITVQQYTQGSGVMLVRYNESFSGWGVTSFWVQGGNGNGKRMLRFRSQPNTPVVVPPEQPQTQEGEQTNENTNRNEVSGSNGERIESETSTGHDLPTATPDNNNGNQSQQPAQQPAQQPTHDGGTEGITQTPDATSNERNIRTSEQTKESTLESTQNAQEAVTDVSKEKAGKSVQKKQKTVESTTDPIKHRDTKQIKDDKKVLTVVVVCGLILGSTVILIEEKRK